MQHEGSPPVSPTPAEDRELLDRCIRKEKTAWDEFVDRYSRLIYQQIYRCLRAHAVSVSRDDAEDLFHSILQALLEHNCKKLRQFEGRCSPASWLRTLTTNRVIDELRRKRPRISLDEEDSEGFSLQDRLENPQQDPEETLAETQRREALKQALKELSAEDRLLAVLSYEREMAVEEIAAVLNISKEAVYTRKHRLHDKLRKTLEAKNLG